MKPRREWTRDDTRRLREHAGKAKAKRIARLLKRTEGAVRQYAGSIGLSLRVKA